MKRAGKQWIAVLTAVALLACAVPTTVYADIKDTEEKLNQAKEEKEKTEEAIDSTKDELNDLQNTTEGLKGQLNSLNNDLTEVSNNLADLEQKIEDKEAEIEQTGKELEEAKQVEEEQYEAMKKRIQFMYEKRDYVLLEMFFGSANFSDLLNRNDYIEQLSADDRPQLTEYQETRPPGRSPTISIRFRRRSRRCWPTKSSWRSKTTILHSSRSSWRKREGCPSWLRSPHGEISPKSLLRTGTDIFLPI